MIGADTGVGRVVADMAAVLADLGVVRSDAEVLGVSMLRPMGDSS
jgi:hypothetical protein